MHINKIYNTKQCIGTRYYRPPEAIIKAPMDHNVDQWALGCIVFELITGNVLFDPHRDNEMDTNACHIGIILKIFGPGKMTEDFIRSGKRSKDYFIFEDGRPPLFKFDYLVGSRLPLYNVLRYYNISKEDARYWVEFLIPFFRR